MVWSLDTCMLSCLHQLNLNSRVYYPPWHDGCSETTYQGWSLVVESTPPPLSSVVVPSSLFQYLLAYRCFKVHTEYLQRQVAITLNRDDDDAENVHKTSCNRVYPTLFPTDLLLTYYMLIHSTLWTIKEKVHSLSDR